MGIPLFLKAKTMVNKLNIYLSIILLATVCISCVHDRSEQAKAYIEAGEIQKLEKIISKNPELVNLVLHEEMNRPTLLIHAVEVDKIEAVKVILRSGAKIDGTDANGLTALHMSASLGRTDILILLMENGADVNAKTASDARSLKEATPLMFATLNNDPTIASLLLSKGAKVNDTDYKNRNALFYCVSPFSNNVKSCEILKNSGANIGQKDNEGRTVFELAKINDKKELLFKAGIFPN